MSVMRFKGFVFICLLLSCNSIDNNEDKAEEVLCEGVIINLMTSSSSIEPAACVVEDGIQYYVVYGLKENYSFASTYDSNFVTKEGFKINMHFNDLPENTDSNFFIQRGWYGYVKLNSGWYAGFNLDSASDYNKLEKDSLITMFFRRKFDNLATDSTDF